MNDTTLMELAANSANQTDKSDCNHTFDGMNYLRVYEDYFRPRRQARDILEIGVLNGGSVRLWRDYFPSARIWGLDIDPSRAIHSGNRIQVRIGDQSDPVCLATLIADSGGFDIVIDDGSHIVSYILASFRILWPALRAGGLYAIEDLRLSYEAPNEDEWRKYHPGMILNGDLSQKRHNRNDFDAEMLHLIQAMDQFQGNVRAIHFHPMQVIIEKTGSTCNSL